MTNDNRPLVLHVVHRFDTGGLRAFALPSLAGGNADLVRQPGAGVIVPAVDAQSMAQQLIALAHNPEQSRTMGVAGRQRALSTFGMQAMVPTYVGVCDRQLHQARST